jgi:glutamate 5-kinase
MTTRPLISERTPSLSDFNRIVIKIGSSLLVEAGKSQLKAAWLASVVEDIARLAARGADILVVSSGSIALGRGVLGLPKGELKLEEKQAAASIGQIALARVWSEELGKANLKASQILLTLNDTEERQNYLNARNTLKTLLKYKVIPIINENDTVATSEIRFGDNDRLAARVAAMISADCLVLLSDIDGLYTAPPHLDPQAKLIPLVPKITAEIEQMAGAAASEYSKGGMFTKIEAGKIATSAGCVMVIASGQRLSPLQHIADKGLCTWFLAPTTPLTARKKWIAGTLEPCGTLTLDEGAVNALRQGKSLLPAGVTRIEGQFSRGDAVILRGLAGDEIGRGLIALDNLETMQIMGKNSAQLAKILNEETRPELIHRDDLVLL